MRFIPLPVRVICIASTPMKVGVLQVKIAQADDRKKGKARLGVPVSSSINQFDSPFGMLTKSRIARILPLTS
jgi:hypothetical protein